MPSPRPCPSTCNVLLIGGGGREHALARTLEASPRLGRLWVTHPGNPGLAKMGRPCEVPMDGRNVYRMRQWCDRNDIHLVVVGPEGPLADGIADDLADDGRAVFGPRRDGARIESDKAFAKQLMRQVSVPTADGKVFEHAEPAREWVTARDRPCVVKAAGLAAGKGVVVCETVEEALEAIDRIHVQRAHGDAGARFIIEEKLTGQEVSVLALVDGRSIWVLDPCQDHKQRDEGDRGPNTGGMGAYCPTPIMDARALSVVEREILVPIVDGLRREGIDYRGVLYAGLMLTPGGPRVLEFNCRFGDPECQPLMARFRGDLVGVLWATATGQLDAAEIDFDDRVACCVVMCAEGYPESPRTGDPITGIDDAGALTATADGRPGTVVIDHAGTTIDHNGTLVTKGGRVLGVTALADDLRTARDLATEACDRITFAGGFFRRDIGHRVLETATAG